MGAEYCVTSGTRDGHWRSSVRL